MICGFVFQFLGFGAPKKLATPQPLAKTVEEDMVSSGSVETSNSETTSQSESSKDLKDKDAFLAASEAR